MMSNWGCYGIEAASPSPEEAGADPYARMEKRIVQACLTPAALEAMYCTTDFFVDGLDGETSMAFVQITVPTSCARTSSRLAPG